MKTVKLIAIGFVLFGLAGCGSFSKFVGSTPLTRNIDDDAIALNNAHARAVNGVITVNILRARDRWPTGYTTLSGVQFMPARNLQGTLNITPLGINADSPGGSGRAPVPRPFVNSNLSGGGSLSTSAQYNVNPFADEDNPGALYSSEGMEGLFQRYFNRGWPIEVVFPIFIDRVTKGGETCHIDGDGDVAKEQNNIFSDPDHKSFDEKYKSSHPCRIVKDNFEQVSIVNWDYQLNRDYVCENGICTPVNSRRRDVIRRGYSHQGGPVDDNPCSNIGMVNASGGTQPSGSAMLESFILGKTQEGLGAKVTALNAASGRELVLTNQGLRLCDGLATGRNFYTKKRDVTTESSEQIIRRFFNAYQDEALAEYILSHKALSSDTIYKIDLAWSFKNVDGSIVSLKEKISDCIVWLKAYDDTQKDFAACSTAKSGPIDKMQLSFLLKQFAKSRTYERPFDSVAFRSFDDMVHFVGETLRLDTASTSTTVPSQGYGLKVGYTIVKNADGKDTKVPQYLFNVIDGSRYDPRLVDRGYGVQVNHAGEDWWALPEKKRGEFLESEPIKERTGAVLTILSQIYLLFQSEDFLEAPDNVLIQ